MDASTRSTLFGIFVVAGKGLTASQLIALANPLGISATNVKSHLSRMVAEGALRRTGPARSAIYLPSSAQSKVVAKVGAGLEAHDASPWNGNWIVVAFATPLGRDVSTELAADLWFDGFRPLAGTVFVRPDWPRPWAREQAAAYERHGGVVLLCAPEGAGGRRLSTLYDLDGLDCEARALARDLNAMRREMSPDRAFAARIRVGGEVARLMGHDPRLPSEIWGARTGMKSLRSAYLKFEDAARPMSKRFLDEVLSIARGAK